MLKRQTAGRIRFYSLRWIIVLFLAIPLYLIAESVWIMVARASKPGGPAVVALLTVPTLLGLGVAALVMTTLRPVTLTRSALRIPSGFRTVVVPIDDIAGVGLLYRKHRAPDRSPSGWNAFVWRRDGSMQRVGALTCQLAADVPPGQIAASRAARMARRLHDKIRAVQGPTGNLARLELQKHASVALTDNLVAFWSPDGNMGPVRY